MKTFVVLSALVLAVCVVSSQGKSHRNSNANTNINSNVNNNFNRDFLSSYLNSMLNQEERKGKTLDGASFVSRAAPDITVQQEEEGQQTADEFQSPVDDDETSFDGPQQDDDSQGDFLTFVPASQLKFFQALAAKTQKQQ